ncbi:MAG: asparagine synthetase B family protein, partial [Alphaproteobacteria bacterium]|nr:asparagine synthetase B family protein [Alphaproteobacteria bacterium]
DIPGEKPLYYTRTKNNDLVFGSEIQALACHPGVETSLNIQSLWDFPTFLWIPEPNTIYNGISVLPRAHYLEFDGTKLSLHAFENKFNEFQYSPSDSWSDLVEKTRAVVSQAVYSRLLSDVPVGAFLSSGLDSSIVCTLARQRLTDLTTFSIGFMPDAVDPYEGHADESAEAEAYARHLGTKHHVIRVRGADFKQDLSLFCQRAGQPYAVSSGLGVMAVAREARKRGIKVLLSGDGADELFGGYSWYKWFSHSAMNLPDISDNPSVSMHSMGLSAEQIISCIAAYAPAKRAWAWHYYASEQEKADLFTQDISNNALSSVRIFESYKPTGAWEVMDYIRQDRACYLPNEMMVKLDRMTMAHSVEGRAPLVAPSILNFVKNLNYEHMVKGDVLKPLLRAAFDDLLPASITRRAKHGFRVPIDTWLKGEWNDLFEEAFSSASALHRLGILSKDAREKAVRMLHDPMRVNGHSLFCFIILNLWLEQNKAISRL